MERVVIDTNVVISGILAEGSPPARIVNAWLFGGSFEPLPHRDFWYGRRSK
jgi:predicted nucleic acid-binding protein